MSGMSSVGNMDSKRGTKFSGSEGKKEDGKNAYFFRADKSDCNGKGAQPWVENKSTLNIKKKQPRL